MPYIFEHDATNGILQSRLQGRVNSDELAEVYRLAADCFSLKHPRSGILDTTGVTSLEVPAQTLREFASLQSGLGDETFVCVVVAASPDIFGTARMLESLAEGTRPNLHIVRTCRQAFAILGVPDPHFLPIGIETMA
jgi:hypothetical protein